MRQEASGTRSHHNFPITNLFDDFTMFDQFSSRCFGSPVSRNPEAMPRARLAPNVISFNAAISSCQVEGRWNEAMHLLTMLKRQPSLSPDLVTFNSTMASFLKTTQWQQSLSLLSRMCHEGVEPDVISFSTAITSCERGSYWQNALTLFEDMCKRDLDMICFDML